MADDEIQKEPPPPEPRRERPSRPPLDDDYDDDRIRRGPSGVETLIPYKNPLGLIAYYCGVFAVIPCAGLLLGPAALILGIMGIRYRNKHPTAGGLGHAITGVVLGTLTTLVNWGAVIFMLAAGGFAMMK